jgi:hypothetical protein
MMMKITGYYHFQALHSNQSLTRVVNKRDNIYSTIFEVLI